MRRRPRSPLEFFQVREGGVESLQLSARTPSVCLIFANRQGVRECYSAAVKARRDSRWSGWHPMRGSHHLIAWEATRARSGARLSPRSPRTGSARPPPPRGLDPHQQRLRPGRRCSQEALFSWGIVSVIIARTSDLQAPFLCGARCWVPEF